MRIRLKPGLPIEFLSLRNHTLGYGPPRPTVIDVDEGELEAIKAELETEVVRTIRTARGEEKSIVSRRVQYDRRQGDVSVLDFLEEAPPEEPRISLEALRAELDRRAQAIADRERSLAERERAALDQYQTELRASEASAEKKDELAGEIRDLLAETKQKDAPQAP